MKNITVSVDDDTYRLARVKAAEMDTSVSALVRKFLSEFGSSQGDFERLKQKEIELRRRITAFDPTDNLSRDELHERRR